MGMLDTYNYEETLLKTAHHILVHDVRGSLANLRSLVQKAVTSHSELCIICSRRAESLADGSKDDVVVFSCGHLYHASCLGLSGSNAQALAASCIVCNKTAAPITKASKIVNGTSLSGGYGIHPPTKKIVQKETLLDSAQTNNLKKFHESYRSRPDFNIDLDVHLSLAPPKLSGY